MKKNTYDNAVVKILDHGIAVAVFLLIVINVVKAYLCLNPDNNTPFYIFWNRGSVKREYSDLLFFLTNISYMLLGMCFLMIFGELLCEIRLAKRHILGVNKILTKKIMQVCLLIIAWVILTISWDGVIP